MRQYRRFPVNQPQPEPKPETPPNRLRVIGQRLNRFYTKFKPALYIIAGILIMLAGMLVYNVINPPPRQLTQRDIDKAVERSLETMEPKPSFASLAYAAIRPSVVRINATVTKPQGKFGESIGTGVVVDQKGIILTCFHVINDAVTINVIFADGSKSEAKVIVEQPENDLAVLQALIIPDDLVPATLTGSDTLNIGDEVFAIGNPFGINNSLSAGVVSGLHRTFRAINSGALLKNLIQFDAAVNPGNSGGPLVNRAGEVVGIVTGLLNPNDDDVFVGIGFATPIETASAAAGSPPY